MPTSRSRALVTIENTHGHSGTSRSALAATAAVAAVAHEPRRAAARRRRPVLQRGRGPRRHAARAGGPGRLGHVLPLEGPRLPGRLGRRRQSRRSSAGRGARGSSLAAACARSGVLAAAGLIALRDGDDGHDRRGWPRTTRTLAALAERARRRHGRPLAGRHRPARRRRRLDPGRVTTNFVLFRVAADRTRVRRSGPRAAVSSSTPIRTVRSGRRPTTASPRTTSDARRPSCRDVLAATTRDGDVPGARPIASR